MSIIKALVQRNFFCMISSNSYKVLSSPFLSIRLLFTKESLGIDAFKVRQKNGIMTIVNPNEFKNDMKKSLEASTNNLVFGNDLKKMIFLTETDEDLDLLHEMVKRYSLNNDVLRFQTFIFGPEIMRIHYILNRPHGAMSLLEDANTTDLFNHLVSGLLLLDLLYENQMYNETIKMFHLISSKYPSTRKYPVSLLVIFMAACYKMNTPESYQEAVTIWNNCRELNLQIGFRAILFFAMLAFKQNKNFIALECLGNTRNSLGENVLMYISANEGRFSEVLEILKMYIYDKNPKITTNKFVTHDILETLEKKFENSGNLQLEFQKIKEQLIAHNFIRDETSCRGKAISAESQKNRISPASYKSDGGQWSRCFNKHCTKEGSRRKLCCFYL